MVDYYVRHVSSAFEIRNRKMVGRDCGKSIYSRVIRFAFSLLLFFFVIYISSTDCWHIRRECVHAIDEFDAYRKYFVRMHYSGPSPRDDKEEYNTKCYIIERYYER